jgi:hypothetical protein
MTGADGSGSCTVGDEMKALKARSTAELAREISERLDALNTGSVWIDLDMERTYFSGEDDPEASQTELDGFTARLSELWFRVVEVLASIIGEAPTTLRADVDAPDPRRFKTFEAFEEAMKAATSYHASFTHDGGRQVEVVIEQEDKEDPIVLLMRLADHQGGAREWVDE